MSPSPASPRRGRRGRLGALATLAVLLAVAGHGIFWYLPRTRPAVLSPSSAAGALLANGSGDRIWLAYPHQNPLAGTLLDLAAALTDGRGLPRFGPFRLPPARELALAHRRDGGITLVVRLYPTWAVLGRLSGALTGNPWLRTGRFEDGREPVAVTWEGSTWTVLIGDPSAAGPAASEPGSSAPPQASPVRLVAAIALDPSTAAELAPETAPFDAAATWGGRPCRPGEAELVALGRSADPRQEARVPGDAEPCSAPPSAAAGRVASCAGACPEVALCFYERVGSGPPVGPVGGERALLWLEPRVGTAPGDWELPRAAALVRGAGVSSPPRPTLPFEKLAKRLDATFYEAEQDGWTLTALDPAALEAARGLATSWAEDAEPAGAEGWAAWIAPGGLGRALHGSSSGSLGSLVDAVGGDWGPLADALRSLESLGPVTLLGTTERIQVRWSRPEHGGGRAAAADS